MILRLKVSAEAASHILTYIFGLLKLWGEHYQTTYALNQLLQMRHEYILIENILSITTAEKWPPIIYKKGPGSITNTHESFLKAMKT